MISSVCSQSQAANHCCQGETSRTGFCLRFGFNDPESKCVRGGRETSCSCHSSPHALLLLLLFLPRQNPPPPQWIHVCCLCMCGWGRVNLSQWCCTSVGWKVCACMRVTCYVSINLGYFLYSSLIWCTRFASSWAYLVAHIVQQLLDG